MHNRLSKRLTSLEKAIEECLQAMSEQRQRDSAAMVESLGTELAERNTVIAHLEEELQQKEHLLQQISVAAAPAAAALPVAPSPQRPAPAKMARIPRNAPQRMMENSSMLYPAQQTLVSFHPHFESYIIKSKRGCFRSTVGATCARLSCRCCLQSAEGYSDESGGPHMVADDREEDDVEALRPSPHRKRITTPPRSATYSTAGACSLTMRIQVAAAPELLMLACI